MAFIGFFSAMASPLRAFIVRHSVGDDKLHHSTSEGGDGEGRPLRIPSAWLSAIEKLTSGLPLFDHTTRILRNIRCCGIGVVYEAGDLRLGRNVAQGFLPEKLAKS
jgi:hypothetical protein